MADYEAYDSLSLSDVLHQCIKTLDALQLELLVMDMTRPDVGMPVARVMVPGLRHFWRRLAPGRLYDVPVKMGGRDTASVESAMNPISMFL